MKDGEENGLEAYKLHDGDIDRGWFKSGSRHFQVMFRNLYL